MTNPPDGDPPRLASLLERHREALVRYLARHAAGLARYETAEDLAQGVHLHALRVEARFEYRGEQAFLGWIFALARQHVADRHAHWKALKRQAGPMLRITYGAGATGEVGRGVQPAADATGPGTFASRRELVKTATRALDSLPERDARYIRMLADGVPLEEMARHLEISYAAAQRARHRAVERFRKVLELARWP